MKKHKEVVVNEYGLEIPIEVTTLDDVTEPVLDLYNTAKLFLYKDATELLLPDEEAKGVSDILTIGVDKMFANLRSNA